MSSAGASTPELEAWVATYVTLTGLPPDGAGERIYALEREAVEAGIPPDLSRAEVAELLVDRVYGQGPSAPTRSEAVRTLEALLRTTPAEFLVGQIVPSILALGDAAAIDDATLSAQDQLKNRVSVSLAYARGTETASVGARAGLELLDGVSDEPESRERALAAIQSLGGDDRTGGAGPQENPQPPVEFTVTREIQSLLAAYVTMTGAPPDGESVASMVDALERGQSPQDILQSFDSDAFRDYFPVFLTAEEFADRLIERLIGDTVGGGAKDFTRAWIVAQLNSGRSQVETLGRAVTSLLRSDNPQFDETKSVLENRVTFSIEYAKRVARAEDESGAVLLSQVTADAGSVDFAVVQVQGNSAGEFVPRQASPN